MSEKKYLPLYEGIFNKNGRNQTIMILKPLPLSL